MTRDNVCRYACRALAVALVAIAGAPVALAVNFTASYTDGASWGDSGLYAQGINPFVNDGPDPGLAEGSPVYLNQLRFFKSGLADSAANIRLAIVSNFFLNLDAFTTDVNTTPAFVGLSINTIASTAPLATGDAFTFQFNGLPLTYGQENYYAAIFVNVAENGVLMPVLVSTLRADYVETPPGSAVFLPETNYGDPDPAFPVDFLLACSNFTHTDAFGTFFDAFGGYADANFVASFSSEPPALAGDYDGDNDVDGDDLTAWKTGFDQTANLAADGDGDGDVDGADFLIWQQHLGDTAPATGSTSAAPEPAVTVLAAVALSVGLVARRRTRREEA
jgi:hypothetical protein